MEEKDAQREIHERWLRELTSIPTAAGCEHRVVRWIEDWVAERPDLALERDSTGNITIRRADALTSESPLYITAHLDHPAFVINEIIDDSRLRASFRGGVMTPYFLGSEIVVFTASDARIFGEVVSHASAEPPARVFAECEISVDGSTNDIRIGDVATWRLPAADIHEGRLRAPACDDLAAVAAALAAIDTLRASPDRDVRILFTLAEEVGFIGAIAACRERTMPTGSRVIALENSRAVDGAVVGGGPIVRVGDRLSVEAHQAVERRQARIGQRPAARRQGVDQHDERRGERNVYRQ